MPKVELTKEQIENLISMIENATFKGSNAKKILDLLEALKKGLENPEEKENLNK